MTASMSQIDPFKPSEPISLAGKRVLVVGLGRFGGGVGVTRWLVSQGAIVTVTDLAGPEDLTESVAAIADLPVTLHLGGHDENDLKAADWVIINPAVHKSSSAFFLAVVRCGIPWTTEMNLFCQRCQARVIGVTGSYGKSTTCAMLTDALGACRQAGEASYTGVHLGGNIGRSLLNELPNIRQTDWVVLEMSNAQLEDLPLIPWAPEMAVITNLFPHHLDRYPSFVDYANAKLNIMRHPDKSSRVVVGDLHPEAESRLWEVIADGRDRVIRIPSSGYACKLKVPGSHNQRNAACVLTVCHLLGLNEALVRDALREFRGLPHRLEFVRTLDGVDYYNDSKSTAPAATVIALEATAHSRHPDPQAERCPGASVPITESPGRTIAIVGGQRKDVPLDHCAKALSQYCRLVICTGESGLDFSEAVKIASSARSSTPPTSGIGLTGGSSAYTVHELSEAVNLAKKEAKPGEIILFSPGAPSFDQYANFTERGRHFVELVSAL